jgi:hypothetical protein
MALLKVTGIKRTQTHGLERRRFLQGMLLAPLAATGGGAEAGGWTTGFGPYEVGTSCMLAQKSTTAPMGTA